MKQYIDKSALVAEIKSRMKRNQKTLTRDASAAYYEDGFIIDIINSLEVKEVDLDKEIQQHINDCLNIKFPTTDIKMIAKDVEYTARRFFELGLKAQKGE